MTRLRYCLPVMALAAPLLLAAPALAASTNITLSPAQVTLGPDGATQRVEVTDWVPGTHVTFSFAPSFPPGFPEGALWPIASLLDPPGSTGACVPSGSTSYTCTGGAPAAFRYSPVTADSGLADGTVFTLTVSTGDATVTGQIVVSIPPPPVEEPSAEPSETSATGGAEVAAASGSSPGPSPSPSQSPVESPSPTPPTSTSTSASEDEPTGGGLNMQTVGVIGSVGLVGVAAGVVGLLGWRRRRDGESGPPDQTDVTLADGPGDDAR